MSSGQSYVGLSGVCSYAITGYETSIMVQRRCSCSLCCSTLPTYCTYSPATLLCLIYRPGGATDKSFHHRWMVFPVSSSIHVECSASFCPLFHISVPVQKSIQDRAIRTFIPAILLNLSLRHYDSIFVPWSWILWIYVTLMTILILTNSLRNVEAHWLKNRKILHIQ